MLSYRHAYHAGNLADVLKHVALCAVLSAATRKETPLFYLDTHAGAGSYRLEPGKVAEPHEYLAGIGALWEQPRDGMPTALTEYLGCVASGNSGARLVRYPGSPAIAARLLRRHDRLRLAELHPKDHSLLAREFGKDPRVQVSREDGYGLLASELPPRERRGIVVIDPNYEVADEGERVVAGLQRALTRFRHGTFIIWFPRAGKLDVPRFETAFRKLAPPKTLALSLDPGSAQPRRGATASGVLILNPPFSAVEPLDAALHYLGQTFTPRGSARTSWLVE